MKSYTLTNWDGTHVGHNQEASQPPSNPSFTGASTLASNPQITSDNTVEYISIGDTIIRKEQEMESTEDTDLVVSILHNFGGPHINADIRTTRQTKKYLKMTPLNITRLLTRHYSMGFLRRAKI